MRVVLLFAAAGLCCTQSQVSRAAVISGTFLGNFSCCESSYQGQNLGNEGVSGTFSFDTEDYTSVIYSPTFLAIPDADYVGALVSLSYTFNVPGKGKVTETYSSFTTMPSSGGILLGNGVEQQFILAADPNDTIEITSLPDTFFSSLDLSAVHPGPFNPSSYPGRSGFHFLTEGTTPGNFDVYGDGAIYAFSINPVAVVPEPISLAAFGIGLLSLTAITQWRIARSKSPQAVARTVV